MTNAPRHARQTVASLGPQVAAYPGGRPVAALGRFWYPKPPVWPTAISGAFHMIVLAALVWTVGNVLDRPVAAEQSVFFIPPPPRPVPPATHGSGGGMMAMLSLSYLSETGAGNGAGSAANKTTRPSGQQNPVHDVRGVQAGVDTAASAGDDVYTSFEVDNAVQISSGSTVPEYPPDLLKRRIQGTVVVRFVVDTTGTVDVQSLEILDSTDPQFAASVRAALPGMRFSPARLNGKRVRQLVEQPFRFNVALPPPSPTDSAARKFRS